MTTLGYLRGLREWASPTRTTSAFLEKGVLTPDEFVAAGDELVYRCPTWSWEGVSTGMDPKKVRDYLPADKQYLITRGVPCQTRSLDQEVMLQAAEGEEDGDGEEWLVSNVTTQKNQTIEDDFDILDEEGEVLEAKPPASTSNSAKSADAAGDDEYADMDAFEDDNVIQDMDQDVVQEEEDDNVLRVRTYDLSMCVIVDRYLMMHCRSSSPPLSTRFYDSFFLVFL